MEKKQLNLKPIPGSNLGFFIEYNKESRNDLGNLFEHFQGKIYVQEATSMLPPLSLEIL
ncbi:MAG: hypothetical protein ACMXYB_05110 [Candidatus Woesearchaeota archaeon]